MKHLVLMSYIVFNVTLRYMILFDRDSLIVGIGNICTSIFAGFVIFSIIGYLAHDLQMPIDKVVDQGLFFSYMTPPRELKLRDKQESLSLFFSPVLHAILFRPYTCNGESLRVPTSLKNKLMT